MLFKRTLKTCNKTTLLIPEGIDFNLLSEQSKSCNCVSREYDSLFYYAVNPYELTEEIKSTIIKRGYLKMLDWLIV